MGNDTVGSRRSLARDASMVGIGLVLGIALGFGFHLFVRLEDAAGPVMQPLVYPWREETLYKQIISCPEPSFIEEHIQDSPDSVNTYEYGLLPLHAVISLYPNDTDLVRMLLVYGADPTIVSDQSRVTYLHSAVSYAAWCGNTELLHVMLEHYDPEGSYASVVEFRRARELLALRFPEITEEFAWPE